jgi:hypothetical protein
MVNLEQIEWSEHYHSHLWLMYMNYVYLYQEKFKKNRSTIKISNEDLEKNFNIFCLMLYESTSEKMRKKLIS